MAEFFVLQFRTVRHNVEDCARALFEFRRILCDDLATPSIPELLTRSQIVHNMPEVQVVTVIGTNRPEWFFVDFACGLAGFSTSPFYTTMSAEVTTAVLEEVWRKSMGVVLFDG